LFFAKGPFLASGANNEVACHLSTAIYVFEFPGTSISPILVQPNHSLASDDLQQVET
jgi:hypothetical protein